MVFRRFFFCIALIWTFVNCLFEILCANIFVFFCCDIRRQNVAGAFFVFALLNWYILYAILKCVCVLWISAIAQRIIYASKLMLV